MILKKSAVDLTDLAIGIVVLGVVVSIGAVILIAQRDARLTDLSTVQTSNESQTITAAGVDLTNTWGKSVDTLTNASGGETVPSSNYSTAISTADGTVTVTATTGQYVDQSWNITYTWYNTSRADWAVANDAAVGIAEYGNWFKIIVIVGVASVVLSLIFLAFGRGSTSSTAGGSW